MYKTPKRGRKGKRRCKGTSKAATNSGTTISVDALLAAQAFVGHVGGIDEASKAIAVLKRLNG
jgi:hypothetical protein